MNPLPRVPGNTFLPDMKLAANVQAARSDLTDALTKEALGGGPHALAAWAQRWGTSLLDLAKA